jgi:hypothetical protein
MRFAVCEATGPGDADTFDVAGPVEICGQPRKATIVLATKNSTAAPASKDPELPSPAI